MKKLVLLFTFMFVTTISNAADIVPLTQSLNGTNITYEYTSGLSFNVKFKKEGVSYHFLTGPKPDKWWGPFLYQAFEVEKDVYFVSWFEKGYGDYVTLLIYFNENILYGSAILSGEKVHFHGAKIVDVERP